MVRLIAPTWTSRAMQCVARDNVDIVAATFDMQSLTGHGERMAYLLGDDGDHDIGVRQKHSVGVFHTHQHFANKAGSIGDDVGRQAGNVPVKLHIRLGIPHDADRIVELQIADLRFVEIGAYLELGEVSRLQDLCPRLDISILGDRKGINRTGKGARTLDCAITSVCGVDRGLCFGDSLNGPG